jgi:hypothetical protein
MKRYLALLLFVIMIVSVVSAAATTATAAPKLARPQLVAPRNHYVFLAGATAKSITFTWKAVSGAVRYVVEFQRFAEGKWTRAGTASVIGTSQYVFFGPPSMNTIPHFGPAGSYRWHVTAQSSDPSLNSAPSAWRYFTVK